MARIIPEDNSDWFNNHLDLSTMSVYLSGATKWENDGDDDDVTVSMAQNCIKAFHKIAQYDPKGEREVTVYLNTQGGDVDAGLAIYDCIRRCNSHVVMVGTGRVMSIGTIILQAADQRVLTPNTTVMIHKGTYGHYGHPNDTHNWTDYARRQFTLVNSLLLTRIKEKHPKFTASKLSKLQQFDHLMTAQGALDLGLADFIWEGV